MGMEMPLRYPYRQPICRRRRDHYLGRYESVILCVSHRPGGHSPVSVNRLHNMASLMQPLQTLIDATHAILLRPLCRIRYEHPDCIRRPQCPRLSLVEARQDIHNDTTNTLVVHSHDTLHFLELYSLVNIYATTKTCIYLRP
jgi:hypothetical protein